LAQADGEHLTKCETIGLWPLKPTSDLWNAADKILGRSLITAPVGNRSTKNLVLPYEGPKKQKQQQKQSGPKLNEL